MTRPPPPPITPATHATLRRMRLSRGLLLTRRPGESLVILDAAGHPVARITLTHDPAARGGYGLRVVADGYTLLREELLPEEDGP